jgi:hypothetical protein
MSANCTGRINLHALKIYENLCKVVNLVTFLQALELYYVCFKILLLTVWSEIRVGASLTASRLGIITSCKCIPLKRITWKLVM